MLEQWYHCDLVPKTSLVRACCTTGWGLGRNGSWIHFTDPCSVDKSYWQLLCVTYLILRGIQWGTTIKMYMGFYVQYSFFLSDLNETWTFLDTVLEECSNINSHENLSSGSWVFMCQQTADQHNKPDSQFSQICKCA